MLIVDAQIHLWSKGTTLPPHRAEPYLMEEALHDMDAAGVDRALIHPPSWDPDSNELAVAAVRAHPARFAILGRFSPERLESRPLVPEWKSRPGMLGLRFTFLQPHMKSWPTDGTIDWQWPAAEKAGVPVALLATEFLPLVGEIAQRQSAAQIDRRSHGRGAPRQGRRRLRAPAGAARAGEAPEHRGEGDRRAGLRRRCLSLPQPGTALPRDLRRVRAAAHVLGHRHHAHAVLVEGMRDPLHRALAVAPRGRQRGDHGARAVR